MIKKPLRLREAVFTIVKRARMGPFSFGERETTFSDFSLDASAIDNVYFIGYTFNHFRIVAG